MKKGDWMILLCIMAVIVVSFSAFWGFGQESGAKQAVIIVDGEEYARYKLAPDFYEIIEIETRFGYNKLEINGEQLRMLDADCEDKLAVKVGAITDINETLICLPNRVLVTILGDSPVDMVSY